VQFLAPFLVDAFAAHFHPALLQSRRQPGIARQGLRAYWGWPLTLACIERSVTAEEEVGHFISLLVGWSLGLIGLTVVIIRLVDFRMS